MKNIRPVSDLRNQFSEIEVKLDEADKAASTDSTRYTEKEVFSRVRERIHGREKV
jgi:hypothetical protein